MEIRKQDNEPAKMSFSVGDVVQLKSGGPAMTVTKVYCDRKVDTLWFNSAKSHSLTEVEEDALQIMTNSPILVKAQKTGKKAIVQVEEATTV